MEGADIYETRMGGLRWRCVLNTTFEVSKRRTQSEGKGMPENETGYTVLPAGRGRHSARVMSRGVSREDGSSVYTDTQRYDMVGLGNGRMAVDSAASKVDQQTRTRAIRQTASSQSKLQRRGWEEAAPAGSSGRQGRCQRWVRQKRCLRSDSRGPA